MAAKKVRKSGTKSKRKAGSERPVDRLFKGYESYHRNPVNELIHEVGIPLILVSTLGLLSHLIVWDFGTGLFRIDGGTLLWAAFMVWYLLLDWKLAVPFSLFGLGCYYFGRAVPVPALAVVFVGCWTAQILGHKYWEHRKPAFMDNILHTFAAPLWLFSKWVGYR